MRVCLLQSVRVLPHHSVVISVQLVGPATRPGPFILQPEKLMGGLQTEESLLHVDSDGTAKTSLVNLTGFTQTVEKGTALCTASEVVEQIFPVQETDLVLRPRVN